MKAPCNPNTFLFPASISRSVIAQFNGGDITSDAGGLHQALLAARQRNCQCVQLFCSNQRQWRHLPLSAADVDAFRRMRRDSELSPVVVHGGYLINLAAANAQTYRRSLAALAEELERSERLGADYLVMHVGAHMGRGEQAGLDRIVASLDRVLDRSAGSCLLLLETTAGQGSCLGHRFEHLAEIIDRAEQPQRLGVCLDTCHIFAAGYDIRTPDTFCATIRQFDEVIGLERLKVIHANDSRGALGCRVDRHEHIGQGYLGTGAFANFLTDPRTRSLPYILETPKGLSAGGRDLDRLNLARLRRAAEGRKSKD